MEQSPVKGANALLTLLIVLNILNMVDRNLISSFGPQITTELGLTDTQFGYLTGLLFVFFYAIMGLFVGRLADQMHRPRLIAAGLALWSLLTIYSGTAKNFLQIGVARMFIGVGEACLTPASMSMLSDSFPQRKRGLASGLYYLGLPLGAGASFIVAGVFGPKIGWRNCFYILGALGLLLLPLLLIWRDPQRGKFDAPAPVEEPAGGMMHSIKLVWGVSRRSPALAWAMIGAVFMHLPIGSAQFVQLWLVRERGFDAAEIAITYGSLFIVFGIIGSLIGGAMSDWYQTRYRGGRLRFFALYLLITTPLLLGYRFVSPDSPVFYIAMCVGFMNFLAFYGPVFGTVQDLTPAKLRGITTAVLLLMCNLVGLGLGAVVTGILSDVYSTAGAAQPLTYALLSVDVLGVFTIVSFFIGAYYWQKEKDAIAEDNSNKSG
ncbi:MAG: MFS transporter [Arenicella sp.]|nr:MFS transporter [Arenicella sp.]